MAGGGGFDIIGESGCSLTDVFAGAFSTDIVFPIPPTEVPPDGVYLTSEANTPSAGVLPTNGFTIVPPFNREFPLYAGAPPTK